MSQGFDLLDRLSNTGREPRAWNRAASEIEGWRGTFKLAVFALNATTLKSMGDDSERFVEFA